MDDLSPFPRLEQIIAFHAFNIQIERWLGPKLIKTCGMTLSQIMILRTIRELDHGSQTDVARCLCLSASAVNQIVKQLIAKGYVRQTPSYSHQREYVLFLTEGGQRQLPLVETLAESFLQPVVKPGAAEKLWRMTRKLYRGEMEGAQ